MAARVLGHHDRVRCAVGHRPDPSAFPVVSEVPFVVQFPFVPITAALSGKGRVGVVVYW